jgi:hypothetical protein
MRISEIAFSGLAAAILLWPMSASALDPNAQAPATAAVPVDAFKSTREAFKTGIQDYNSGDKAGAAKALEYAAQQGHPLARWKLGRMYADGDGVPQDDLKAFEHFSKIADENADESPDSQNASVVASAFVALGTYYLDGIPNSYVKANPARARDMFYYAASYFRDSDAQYNLARMLIEGNGGPKDPRQAMRWLNLAAEKGHMPAQALLGHLLFTGEGGARQRALGLMWLTIARDASDKDRDNWVRDLYDRAFSQAADPDRQAALMYLEQQLRKRN